jgi:hypothetical protein
MVVSAEERREMIAVAAYFLAEQRGFAPDGAADDWLQAERQIDRMLDAIRAHGISRAQFERAGLRNALHLWQPDRDSGGDR